MAAQKGRRIPLVASLLGVALVLCVGALAVLPASLAQATPHLRVLLAFFATDSGLAGRQPAKEEMLRPEERGADAQQEQEEQQGSEVAERAADAAGGDAREQAGEPAAEGANEEQEAVLASTDEEGAERQGVRPDRRADAGQQADTQQPDTVEQAAEAQRGERRPGQRRCAVYNGVSHHIDVAAGLAWAFQEAGCAVTFYLDSRTRGLQDAIQEWYRGQYRPPEAALEEVAEYEVLVMVTLPEGFTTFEQQYRVLAAAVAVPAQRQLVVVHNPNQLVENTLTAALLLQHAHLPAAPQPAASAEGGAPTGRRGGAGGKAAKATRAKKPQQKKVQQQEKQQEKGKQHQQGTQRQQGKQQARQQPSQRRRLSEQPPAGALVPRMQVASLAPFVANYTRSLLETWGARRSGQAPRYEVVWLPPLVPHAATDGGVPERELRHLCIQGTVDPMRRDYAAAFAAASHPAVMAALRRGGEQLLLVGSVRRDTPLAIPEAVQRVVRYVENLPYEEYYATLARCRAILTAFPDSDVYFINKSSSTLAAAIHVGTPLVAEERVVQAYSYLSRDALFVHRTPPGTPARDPVALAAAAALVTAEAQEAAEAAAAAAGAGGSRAARRRLGEGEGGGGAREDEPEPPERGSYAAALLGAFDERAAAAAHRAARRLKAELMRRNVQLARRLLEETAARAALLATGDA